MKIIHGDLIMKEDLTFHEDLRVEGNIFGKDGERFDLNVKGNLNCGNLNCGNLYCWDLECRNLDCGDLNCLNLDCWNVSCRNLDCWNLNCGNLSCRNCSYHAVAFAYNNIRCKSITGRRENCKEPFVLDGKIEIINEVLK